MKNVALVLLCGEEQKDSVKHLCDSVKHLSQGFYFLTVLTFKELLFLNSLQNLAT